MLKSQLSPYDEHPLKVGRSFSKKLCVRISVKAWQKEMRTNLKIIESE